MSPWRSLPLLVILLVGGCKGDTPDTRIPGKLTTPNVAQTTKPVEKAQDRAADAVELIDKKIAAKNGEIEQLRGERKAALDRAERAETQAVDRCIFILTLILVFGVAAATVLAIWWQSKSFALLALAAGGAIPVVRATKLAINHPIITGAVVVVGAVTTLLVMLAKSDKVRDALTDAVTFGKNAMGHLQRVEPSAAELVKLMEKERQDVNKTRDTIKKTLQGVK